MKEKWKKRDAGTIFNPVMFLVVLMLTAQLLVVGGKTYFAGELLSEVTDEPLTLEKCLAVFLRVSVFVGVGERLIVKRTQMCCRCICA